VTNAAEKLNKIRIKRMNKVYHVLPIDFDGCGELPPPIALETLSAHFLCGYTFTCYLPIAHCFLDIISWLLS